MAISLKRTGTLRGATKFLVHGLSGAGKTRLIATLPNPVVVSAESGLASIRGADVAYVEVKSLDDVYEAYSWLTTSPEGLAFESIAIDSLSEIAEVLLADEKRTAKDPRQAYGAMQDKLYEVIRAFREIPRHVYMIAKTEKATDETGRILYSPMTPGNKAQQGLPYFFDEVYALRTERSADGEVHSMLMTSTDGQWSAKSRSGRLDAWEPPDLGAIIRKIEADHVPSDPDGSEK